MLVATPPQLPHSLAQLVRVERDGNPLRKFGHASPFIGKLAALDGESLDRIARATWKQLPRMNGKTLVVGMTESSLLLSWFLARHAPTTVDLCFTTRERRPLEESSLQWRTFEEPHSHGPRHFIALEKGARFDQIVIVEDELTTGATLRNLLLTLQDVAPSFFVVTLCDMRPLEAKSQLLCDMLERGLSLRTFDLSAPQAPVRQLRSKKPLLPAPMFNPYRRSEAIRDEANRSLDCWRESFDFGAIYMVGECVDMPLSYWSTLPESQRPAIQHITRSPWKVDGEEIRSRADFPGDGTSSRYFLYNFVPFASRAVIIYEALNAAITAQARDFFAAHGVDTRCIEVAAR